MKDKKIEFQYQVSDSMMEIFRKNWRNVLGVFADLNRKDVVELNENEVKVEDGEAL